VVVLVIENATEPSRTRAIPERLRGVLTRSRYTNPCLPTLPYCFCVKALAKNQAKFSHAEIQLHRNLASQISAEISVLLQGRLIKVATVNGQQVTAIR